MIIEKTPNPKRQRDESIKPNAKRQKLSENFQQNRLTKLVETIKTKNHKKD